MNDRNIIAHPCSIVFCIFIAFYNYQVHAADTDRGNAAASENKVRIPIRNKNGGVTQVSLAPTDTIEKLKEQIEIRTGIPPAQQIITANGGKVVFNLPDNTELKDVPELGAISKMSHLVIVANKNSVIATFDEPLRNFIERYKSDSNDWITAFEELNITQLEQISNYSEKEFIGTGMKFIAAKKLLQYYLAFIKPISVSESID